MNLNNNLVFICPVTEICKKLSVQIPDIGARHDICLLNMNGVEALVLTIRGLHLLLCEGGCENRTSRGKAVEM
jgi:hypothetical protein